MNWQKVIKSIPSLFFALIIFVLFTFLFYRLTDEKLTSHATTLLVTDGLTNQQLRQNWQQSNRVVILPRDSIFDHLTQVQEIENQHQKFKKKIEDLKQKSLKHELKKALQQQIENSIESLYAINPISLMALNLKIIEDCVVQMKASALSLDQQLLVRVRDLDEEPLFLRAARFHVQSVLGSIRVLSQSSLIVSRPSIFFIQKQRLTNLMAQISLDPQVMTSQLSGQMVWYDTRHYELLYAQFFKKLIHDPKINLKSQIHHIRKLNGI